MNRASIRLAILASIILTAFSSLAHANGRILPSARPSDVNYTTGCLECSTGGALANCTVTLEYWDSSGILVTATVVTDSDGCFSKKITCTGSNQQGEHWVISASCCPSNSWTIPTTKCWGDLGTLVCEDCTGCTSPPANMVGWWQLDESGPGTSADMAGGNTCAWIGAPTVNASQYVGKSLQFATANDYVSCPTPNGNANVGTGDFSIDAWIKSTDLTENYRTIVDHRQKVVQGSLKLLYGYQFYTTYGFLGLQIADGTTGDYTYFLPKVIDGLWHHVAATVQRGVSAGGVKLYVDGVPQFTNFDPTPHMGSLNNSGSVRIGQAYDGSSAAFNGSIDEVEIFRRALTPAEVAALYAAGTRGKCKDACYVPWDVPMCSNATSATTNLTICNYSTAPVTYNYSLVGLPTGPGCSFAGPTVFSPMAGTVTVAGGACMNVPISIGNPGLTGNLVSCYRATVTNTTTGRIFHCDGSVQGNPCTTHTWATVGTIAVVLDPVILSKTLTFVGTNLSPVAIDVPVMIDAMPGDMSPDERIVSLNGLPPGEPVRQTVHLDPGQTVNVQVECAFSAWDPFMAHSIMLNADVDGDGLMEAVTSYLVYQGSATPVAVDNGPGRTPVPGLAVSPAPFRDHLDVSFTLDAASPVLVQICDVTGRVVRTLSQGVMQRGPQQFSWDGRYADGRVAGTGLYLVRVQAGTRVLSAKVLRTR